MWKWIKSDIIYHKRLFLILYGFLLPLFVVNAIWFSSEKDMPKIIFLTLPVLGIFAGSEEVKTKQIRLLVGLPLPLRKIGLGRFVIFIGFWSSLMLLFALSVGIRHWPQLTIRYLWQILSMTGTVFIIVSCMQLNFDWQYCFCQPGLRVGLRWLAIFVAIAFTVFYFMVFAEQINLYFIFKIFYSAGGSFFLMISGMALMLLSITVFKRRLSYLE